MGEDSAAWGGKISKYVGQAFIVQDDQSRQVMLEMLKLAPILEEISEDVCVSGYERRGSHHGKLHQMLILSRGGVRDRT